MTSRKASILIIQLVAAGLVGCDQHAECQQARQTIDPLKPDTMVPALRILWAADDKRIVSGCASELIRGERLDLLVLGATALWAMNNEDEDMRFPDVRDGVLRAALRLSTEIDTDRVAQVYSGLRDAADTRWSPVDVTPRDLSVTGRFAESLSVLNISDEWMSRLPGVASMVAAEGTVVPVRSIRMADDQTRLIDQTMVWSKIYYMSSSRAHFPGRTTARVALDWIGSMWGGGRAGVVWGRPAGRRGAPAIDDLTFCDLGNGDRGVVDNITCVFVEGDYRGIGVDPFVNVP